MGVQASCYHCPQLIARYEVTYMNDDVSRAMRGDVGEDVLLQLTKDRISELQASYGVISFVIEDGKVHMGQKICVFCKDEMDTSTLPAGWSCTVSHRLEDRKRK